MDAVWCDVAYSCGSVTAVFHTVINDSHSLRLAAQFGGENQNLDEVESLDGRGGLNEMKDGWKTAEASREA